MHEVHLLIRGARTKRDRVLLEVLYAGGLRVSELAGLTWSDVLARDKGQVQLSVVGKGGIVRQVLLPEGVSRALTAPCHLVPSGEKAAHAHERSDQHCGTLPQATPN